VEKTVAVIDIGMTNKKISVYDRRLAVLESISRKFEPLRAEGVEAHDLMAMEEWFLDALSALGKRFPLGAVAVSAHGATMVAVGADGRPCAPCVFYTHEPEAGFHEKFRALSGEALALQDATGTAPFGALLNQAKGLLFLRETFPADFSEARRLLFLAQYWGFRLTGKAAAEGTSVGCHTYLWDWRKDDYSFLVDALGIRHLLPSPQRRPWDILGTLAPDIAARTGLPADTVVTMGIHDSNASLLLHLLKEKGDFVLNSTGTWCVAMHPQDGYGFREGEAGKALFFLRSAYGKPVKTAIFPGGMEFDAWTDVLAARVSRPLSAPGDEDYLSAVAEGDAFVLPGIIGDSGLFPNSRARIVQGGVSYSFADIASGAAAPPILRDARAARAVLDLSLAIQTLAAVDAAGGGPGCALCTEGGFRANRGYNALLAAASAGKARLSDVKEATSLGAAISAVAALEGVDPRGIAERVRVEYEDVAPMRGLEGFDRYVKAWKRLAGSRG
jgi:L-fuculokinase